MAGTRNALIVASYDYTDPGLRQLHAPASDARALEAVLQDPGIGGFDVRTLLNAPTHEINLAVEEFFADRRPDDLLLVHFSCHGVKDEDGDLYFATSNTMLRRLGATAVGADFVNRCMGRSRSRRIVLLLDCCYAGAFERGMTARAGTEVGIEAQLGGRGRAVITASSAMEYAFEGEQLADVGEPEPSVFTSALVNGLETGEADRDQDGLVALDELYDYIYDAVRATTPNQTPGKWMFGVQGEMVIARRSHPVSTPAELPRELQEVIDSPLASVRTAAVQELTRLLTGRHAGLALAARLALERLTSDDSRTVAAAATAALATQAPAPPAVTSPADGLPAAPPAEDSAAAEDVGTPAPPDDAGVPALAEDAAALAEAGNIAALVPSEDAAASVPGEDLATPVPADDIATPTPADVPVPAAASAGTPAPAATGLEAETPAPTATLAPLSGLEAETPARTAEPAPLRAETKPPGLTADDAPPQDRTEPSARAEPPSPPADVKAEVPGPASEPAPAGAGTKAPAPVAAARPGNEPLRATDLSTVSSRSQAAGLLADLPRTLAGVLAISAALLGWAGLSPLYRTSSGSAFALASFLPTKWYVILAAVVDLVAGACLLIPRTKRLIGPGLLLGNAAVSAGGLVSLFVALLGPDSYGSGFWLEFASSLAEVAAAGLALMAVVRTEEIRWSRRPMRAAFVWVIVLVAVTAAVAVAFHIHNIAALISRQDLTTAIWTAVMALGVPVCALAVRPARFAIALLGGWLAADVVFLVYHFLYLGNLHGNGVAVSSVPLIVFTLAVVVLVTAAALSGREAFSAGAQGPA
jgi:hypothetical protein